MHTVPPGDTLPLGVAVFTLLSTIWRTSITPHLFLLSTLVYIPAPGRHTTLASNYTRITLTSVMYTLLSRVAHARLSHAITARGIIGPRTHTRLL